MMSEAGINCTLVTLTTLSILSVRTGLLAAMRQWDVVTSFALELELCSFLVSYIEGCVCVLQFREE